MEWELKEILSEVKRLCYSNVHVVERLMLYNSMAQNAAMAILNEQRGKQSVVLSLEQMEAIGSFAQIREELFLLCNDTSGATDKAFYLIRRRMIENIQVLLIGAVKLPSKTVLANHEKRPTIHLMPSRIQKTRSANSAFLVENSL